MSQSTHSQIQPSLFEPLYGLDSKRLRTLQNSWAEPFRTVVLPKLMELEPMFAPLYSEKMNTRPSTLTYVVLGLFVLKSLFDYTDEQVIEHVQFSIQYRYALDVPFNMDLHLNERTLERFRAAVSLYANETGDDLLVQFAEKLAVLFKDQFLGTNLKRRMDSIMISNGCRRLSRLQLAHMVTKNALQLLDDHQISIPENLHHYIGKFDENQVTYHSDLLAASKLETAFRDACAARDLIPAELQNTEEAQLLNRFISEQVILSADGSFEAVRDGKTLTSTTLANLAEPEGTVRTKAGETHLGFVGNFAETVDLDTDRKFIDSMDLHPNIYSDVQFTTDELQKMSEAGETLTAVADGAYISVDNVNKAAEQGDYSYRDSYDRERNT